MMREDASPTKTEQTGGLPVCTRRPGEGPSRRALTDEEFQRLIDYMKKVGEEIDRKHRAEARRKADMEYMAFRRMGALRGKIKFWKMAKRGRAR